VSAGDGGEGRDLLDLEPEQLADRAAVVGKERLARSLIDIAITAAIGGVEVSVGGLAAMAVVGGALTTNPHLGLFAALALGGLVFPIGFLFVIVGRSELFTENFLIPVLGVLRHEAPARTLVGLWSLSWLGNLFGCAVMAALISIPQAVGEALLHGYQAYSEYKLSVPPVGTFVSGLIAGIVMTVLTWLLLAVRHPVAKIAAIFAAGFVLFAANVSHGIVGASILFVGFRLTPHPVSELVLWLILASLGNLIGGVGFVTLFRLAQVKEKERQS
jgi:formate/nitrite transporter FocA (FNT family)